MFSVFARSKTNKKDSYQPESREANQFYSQFVIKALKNSGIDIGTKPLSSPKVLEAALHRSLHFELKHNTGSRGIKDVWAEIIEKINKIAKDDPGKCDLVSHILTGLAELKTSDRFISAGQELTDQCFL